MSEVASSISVGDSFTVKNGTTHEVTGFVKKGGTNLSDGQN
ncbi:hypothetical protein [Rahnella aquatilis]|nr:hypothetical protein [Rahnella aquatilis]